MRQSRLLYVFFSLALVAAVVLALLPGGQQLKRLGPCGRVLCECHESLPSADSNCCAIKLPATARMELTFSPDFHGVDSTGFALQMVFSGLPLPHKIILSTQGAVSEPMHPFGRLLSVMQVWPEIPTPPPKA